MGPVVFGDEIEVRDVSGMDGGEKRFFPGVTDRGGGKTRHEVGIVRSLLEEMFLG